MQVLQSSSDSFLVCKLLVDRVLGGMRARVDFDADLKPRRQTPQQLHPDGQTNQRGHAAVRYRGRVQNLDRVLVVIDVYQVFLQHVKLLQR